MRKSLKYGDVKTVRYIIPARKCKDQGSLAKNWSKLFSNLYTTWEAYLKLVSRSTKCELFPKRDKLKCCPQFLFKVKLDPLLTASIKESYNYYTDFHFTWLCSSRFATTVSKYCFMTKNPRVENPKSDFKMLSPYH